MDPSIPVIKDIVTGVMATGIVAMTAIGLRSSYSFFRRRIQLRHMRNIFGDVDLLRESSSVVIPTFQPLSYDEFHKGKGTTYIDKNFIASANGVKLEKKKVPLYSDVLVLDDYLAYDKVNAMLMNNGYGAVEFIPDIDALKEWKKHLIVCIGGPRSNQKLRQVMNTPAMEFFEVNDVHDLLSNWQLNLDYDGERHSYVACDVTAYAYVMKVSNPNFSQGKIMAIAGDCSYGTDMAAEYLKENLVALSQRYKGDDFFILLTSDKGNIETMHEVIEFALENGQKKG